MANKSVLITGAAGFIGSHLSERFLNEGWNVIGVDNFLTGRRENMASFAEHENFKFIESDLNDELSEVYSPNEANVDLVLHFASPASPPRYQKYPRETYLVNSLVTDRLLSLVKDKWPQATFLFASTSEVYGDPAVHPQKEDYWGNVNPNGIRSCYDEAKRLGETICGVFNRDFGLDTRIIRIFNTYGPRMDPADGRVVPAFMSSALVDQPIEVFGDGSQTRSYCYVDDLVEGIFRMATYEGLAGQTVNLGNPGEMTVLETANLIKEITGSNSELVFKPLPGDDPTRRKPDISKAKELLGWEPKITANEGLKKLYQLWKVS